MSSRGMHQNVARALGYAGERSSPQSVSCHKCSAVIIFDTNEIGQTIEKCPRGCYSRNISSGRADPVEAAELARRLEENRNLELQRIKTKEDRNRDRYGEKVCELDGCDQVFVPRSGNQRFCSQQCASTWTGVTRGAKNAGCRTKKRRAS